MSPLEKIRKSYDHHWPLIRSLGVRGWLAIEAQTRNPEIARRLKYRLFSRNARHPLAYRPNDSDLEVFNQIFIFGEYESIRNIPAGGLIIDCGANVGYSSAWFLTRFPHARVIAIEPDAGNFEMLERNLAPFGSSAAAIHGAVWPRRVGLSFDKQGFRDGLSWTVRVRQAEANETPQVEGYDIPTLMRLKTASRIALLKVDIEGAELELFGDPSSAEWISLCDNIVIELHDAERERVFFEAIGGEGFSVRRTGELVICSRE